MSYEWYLLKHRIVSVVRGVWVIFVDAPPFIRHTWRMSDIWYDKSYHLLTSQNSGLREEARRAIVLAHDDHFVAVGPVIDALCVGGLAIHVRVGVQFVHVAATCTRCSGEREGIMAMRKRCKVTKKKGPFMPMTCKQNQTKQRVRQRVAVLFCCFVCWIFN